MSMFIVFAPLHGRPRSRHHVSLLHGQHPDFPARAAGVPGMRLIDDLLQLRIPLEFLIIKQCFQFLFHFIQSFPFPCFSVRGAAGVRHGLRGPATGPAGRPRSKQLSYPKGRFAPSAFFDTHENTRLAEIISGLDG
ncbi:MAG: hypothetical protein IKE24_04345 [Clostridia bacterium]|nr:hypothetical protein [Clostridia bacterium]